MALVTLVFAALIAMSVATVPAPLQGVMGKELHHEVHSPIHGYGVNAIRSMGGSVAVESPVQAELRKARYGGGGGLRGPGGLGGVIPAGGFGGGYNYRRGGN